MHFRGNWPKTTHLVFDPKEKEAKNYSERFLVEKFEKGEENFDLLETTFFCQTGEMGQILTKTVFLLKWGTAKLSFWGNFKHFLWNWAKYSLLGQKIDNLRKKLIIAQIFFFFQQIGSGKSL